jgi:hypothetical protein
MTEAAAFSAARRFSRLGIRHVVYEDGEYDVATDADLEAYWQGAKVVATYEFGEACYD